MRQQTVRSLIALLSAVLLLQGPLLAADPLPVRFTEGTMQGFLALKTMEGELIAAGDILQVAKGARVTSELVFRFLDGSLDSDTAVFSQHRQFRLISDHRIQKGPSFPKPLDVLIRMRTGQVTVRFKDKDEEKIETNHLNLPSDLANGMICNVLRNIAPDARETKVSYLVATPKPEIVRLVISPQGEETFSASGLKRKAMRYVVKVELGGLKGLLASIFGKKPSETNVWVAQGKAPALIRADGPLYLDAPTWSIQMASPTWGTRSSGR
jgi:hypothetical protein